MTFEYFENKKGEIFCYHKELSPKTILMTQLCDLREEIRMTEANLKIMKKALIKMEDEYYDWL